MADSQIYAMLRDDANQSMVTQQVLKHAVARQRPRSVATLHKWAIAQHKSLINAVHWVRLNAFRSLFRLICLDDQAAIGAPQR